jgi:hypothetical protein
MSKTTIEFDQADEELLSFDVSDEAMERAGDSFFAVSIAMCSGLQSCPSAPA